MELAVLCGVLMVVVGLLLLLVVKNEKKDNDFTRSPTSRPAVSRPMASHPAAPAPVLATTGSASESKEKSRNEIAKNIYHIYYYSASVERTAKKIWVCRDCETENRLRENSCALCGAPRTGGR